MEKESVEISDKMRIVQTESEDTNKATVPSSSSKKQGSPNAKATPVSQKKITLLDAILKTTAPSFASNELKETPTK